MSVNQDELFSPERLDDIRLYWHEYDGFRDRVDQEIAEATQHIPAFAAIMRQMTPQQLDDTRAQGRERERRAVEEGAWGDYVNHLQGEGAHYARMGVPFGAWYELVSSYRAAILPILFDSVGEDVGRLRRTVQGLQAFVDLGMRHIAAGYLDAKQEQIVAQQEAIRELSTPVLVLRERLLIVPLVGMIDSERARLLTETMLSAIREHRALAVVMDITGVPVVDSQVANHFVQSVSAARLMGAEVILTGISPEIARTLVAIGADLRGIRTLGDLRAGVAVVEAMLDAEAHPSAAPVQP